MAYYEYIQNSELKRIIKKYVYTSFCIFLLIFSNRLLAQTKTYLTGNVTGNRQEAGVVLFLPSPGSSGITGPFNSYLTPGYGAGFYYQSAASVLSGTTTDSATLTASRAVGVSLLGIDLLTLSGGNTYIQFRNALNKNVSSSKSIFFKLGKAPQGGNLSVPVGGLLSLGSSKPFVGQLYKAAINFTGTSENPGTALGGTAITELLLDKTGVYYCRVSSTNKADSFNSARLKIQIPSDVLKLDVTNTFSINVHNAYYMSSFGPACSINPMFVTRGEIDGISLDVGSILPALDLNNLIADPQYAIDANESTYSVFKSGLADLGVSSSVTQSFLFDHAASPSDGLRLLISIPTSLLSLSLLNNLYIDFYNNDTLKSSSQLGSNLIDLDLLTLPILGAGYRSINTVFRPAITFDRVKIRLAPGLLSVSLLGDGIRVHEVSLAPAVPAITVQPSGDTVCSGQPAVFSATASGAASYQWEYYDEGTSSWINAPGTSATLNITATTITMDNRRYRVSITGTGTCPQTASSHPAILKVNHVPRLPPVIFGP